MSPRGDAVWFLALPFLATAIALASQRWLSSIAVVAFSLWVTTPHHFATWLRAYGNREDRSRWSEPLVVGPLVIGLLTGAGILWAPMSLLLVAWLWDHQHSIMQQYGFARIYDVKARTGGPGTARADLALGWVLYVNLLVVSPLYSDFWIRELYRFGLPIGAAAIQTLQTTSAGLTALFLLAYLGQLARSMRQGQAANPIKYLFIGSSYFLWYCTAWWSQSVLVATIAHAIMHGVQYLVLTHTHLRRKGSASGAFAAWLVAPRHVIAFLGACLVYSIFVQWLAAQPLETFAFGAIGFATGLYPSIPELGKPGYTPERARELLAALVIQGAPLVHYFLDSFIWKMRDDRIREAL
ncbi:MAG: hypothetical protein IPK00_10645 [Deltaproteobacteria bacterium]|nr:hypothetical protein [Deltaproteobacteria bacterium]